MRIISTFHDYYDTVGRVATDMSILYIRKPSHGEPLNGPADFRSLSNQRLKYDGPHMGVTTFDHQMKRTQLEEMRTTHLIIAAGTPHLVRVSNLTERDRDKNTIGTKTVITIGDKKVRETLQETYGEDAGNAFQPKDKDTRKKWGWRWSYYQDRVTVREWMTTVDWDQIHKLNGCPLLEVSAKPLTDSRRSVGSDSYPLQIEMNPKLDQYEFQRAVDPYTMFMNLEQYISGVLGQDSNPMVQLSDEEILVKHGFDPKWGFRKQPEHMK